MTLRGIDVSEYQGLVNWTAVRRSGIQFAAIKATEGLGYRDPYFNHNWNASKQHGIVRGAYHFLHPSYDGRSQADYLHAFVRDNGHFQDRDFVMLDLEVTDGLNAERVIQCAVDFTTRCLEQINKQVVLYTGLWFWEILGLPRPPLLMKRPLWLAAYQATEPAPLPGWPVLSFWQNSASAWVPGVNGQCDVDVFEGTMEQLHQVLKWP